MTDRPILFSAPMIRALLAGRKTQTRRMLSPNPALATPDRFHQVSRCVRTGRAVWEAWAGNKPCNAFPAGKGGCTSQYHTAAVGDRLWVREAWSSQARHDHKKPVDLFEQTAVYLRGTDEWRFDGHRVHESLRDHPGASIGRYRPGMFMPRWASRLTLIVEDVRVQRLQEISEADAIAEGTSEYPCEGPYRGSDATYWSADRDSCASISRTTAVDAYAALWNSLHAKTGERWEDNHWIVATTFRIIQQNIDNLIGSAAA